MPFGHCGNLMKPVRLILFVLVSVFLLTACVSALSDWEEKPQHEVITLQITPAMEHWTTRLADCAQNISDFGIYTQVRSPADLSLADSDLILRLGERLEDDPYVAVMGVEEIVIVAGADVPVTALSLDNLQAIYAGEINNWADVSDARTGQVGGAAPIKPLTYPAGHELAFLFKRAFLHDVPIPSAAQTYSTVAFLEELLVLHPTGIGYLLQSKVPEGVRTLQINADELIASKQYVLAVTPMAPEGRLKALLVCLQSAP